MAPKPITLTYERTVEKTRRDFSQAAYWAALMDDQAKVDIGTLVEKLIASNLELARTDATKPKIHALVWANLAFLVTIVFFCGVLYNRVSNLELAMSKVQSTEGLSTQIQDLRTTVDRMQTRLDQYLDGQSSKGR